MKSSDEIKKGLECCTIPLCDECPYDNEPSCVVKNADALALIRQLEAQVPRWISVEERLPKYDEEVLLSEKVGKYTMLTVGYLGEDGCFYTGAGCPYVTHWTPLPEPPKEE